MQNAWVGTAFSQHADGPTLTAAAAASMLIASSPAAGQNRFTIPANSFKEGDVLTVEASGICSQAITTPGTFRVDIRFGATVVFDSTAIALETAAAQTNIPWYLKIMMTIKTIGATTAATLWGTGFLIYPGLIGNAAQTTGPGATQILPYNSAGAISTGFDSTIANVFDSFFTQTVGTGSFTCKQYSLKIET